VFVGREDSIDPPSPKWEVFVRGPDAPGRTLAHLLAVADSERDWTRLEFDARRPFGNAQHYFHFMWGYLLPALDRILSDLPGPPSPGFEVQSCGPVMDPRLRELAGWLDVPIRFAGAEEAEGRPVRVELVPRWDLWLRSRTSFRLRLALAMSRAGRRHPVLAGIERVREFVLSHARGSGIHDAGNGDSTSVARGPCETGDWLLLKRSEEPAFYREGGPAEKPTYGVTRRSIANLESLTAELARRGLPVRIYEPGRDDLAQQVRRYQAAAGVIGIRGAELANIVWMKPGSRVVMLVTPVKRENNVARHIALVCGLKARRIHVGSDHPIVSADEVLRQIDASCLLATEA
jgi:hypothetical protein